METTWPTRLTRPPPWPLLTSTGLGSDRRWGLRGTGGSDAVRQASDQAGGETERGQQARGRVSTVWGPGS